MTEAHDTRKAAERRKELARDVEAFLAAGGRIHNVDQNVMQRETADRGNLQTLVKETYKRSKKA